MKSRFDKGSPRTAEKVTRFQLVTMVSQWASGAPGRRVLSLCPRVHVFCTEFSIWQQSQIQNVGRSLACCVLCPCKSSWREVCDAGAGARERFHIDVSMRD